MADSEQLEWDKEGDGVFQVRASNKLDTGVELTGTPTVAVQKLTNPSDPEDWNSAVGVVVSSITIVDAVSDDGATNLGTQQAVQFQINKDTDPLPDETDDPIPGTNYRVVAVADIAGAGAGDWVGKRGLTIHP